MAVNSRSILFFGDASQDPFEALDSLIRTAKEDTLVHRFLDNACTTLQEELFRLPEVERLGLPDFGSLSHLTRYHRDGEVEHPALQTTGMVIIQLASYISANEQTSHHQYLGTNDNIIIGSCVGEISAAAVSLASNLIELLPLAVAAVKVAFRLAAVAYKVSKEVEQPSPGSQYWSVAIDRSDPLIDQGTLDRFHAQLGIPGRNRVYFSAFGHRTMTLSGPPTSLKQVINNLDSNNVKRKLYDIRISAAYHASHLYSSKDISAILEPTSISGIYGSHEWQEQRRAYISCSNGSFVAASSGTAILEQALTNVLISPLNWELLVKGCKEAVSERSDSKWAIRPFGPTPSLQNLVSGLKISVSGEVEVDETFWQSGYSASCPTKTPLAIVGMAGKFPNASNHDRLWEILMERRDCHTTIPKDRFNPDTHLRQPAYGCFIESPGMFDTRFFNMSPREALQTDPGQRLALVTAYEALEMAGFVPNRTPSTQLSRIGTFYGQTVDEYKEQNMPQAIDTYFITGSLRAFGPGRINRHFKFGGPASSLDTACSSGSVALNTACTSIWSGECDMAVVGGINIVTGSDNFVGLSAGAFLSSTGNCKTFDDAADGYCRADTVASVVIKRLDAAKADNDNILGVILSAATNYAADAVSITRPHSLTQESLYWKALDQAGLRPFDIDYVEMHGTGTQAGDACEMESITNVFAPATQQRPLESPLYVNAIKANIGHGEAASGITSLIKSLLVLREQMIPPHIGVKDKLNRNFVNLVERNLRIPMTATALPLKEGTKRRILVNNFGAAGGNTAVIVEEPDAVVRHQVLELVDQPDQIVNVTAKSAQSLRTNVQRLLDFVDSNPDVSLPDLSYTTTTRRIPHPLRVSVVGSALSDIRASLESSIRQEYEAPGKPSNLVFVFSGQGVVYTSLGRDLFESSSYFRSSIMRLNEIAKDYGFPPFLMAVDGTCHDISSLTATQTQLAITATQIALCRLWASLGVHPDIVVGHSLGEYASLYVSGVLSMSDTIYLVGKRAQILEIACPRGTHAMLAVSASAQSLTQMRGIDHLEVACINGPNDTVLSGPLAEVQKGSKDLQARGIKCKMLEIPYGFHSSQIEPMLEGFREVTKGVTFNGPNIPVISPVLGTVINDAGIIDSAYLPIQARQQINFAGSIQFAQAHGLVDANTVWLELGPHPLCLSMVRSTLGSKVRGVATLRRDENSWRSVAQAVSTIFKYGFAINWQDYNRDFEATRKLLILPSYSFEDKNYWMEYQNDWLLAKSGVPPTPPPEISDIGPATTTVQRLISHQLTEDGTLRMLFESDLSDLNLHAAIVGHAVNGSGLCPASIYGDIALTIANYTRENYEIQVPTVGIDICDMLIRRPVVVPQERPIKPELLHILVHVYLDTGRIQLQFGRHSTEAKNTDWVAKCTVQFGDAKQWLYEWSKMTYLIATRIESLEKGVSQGTSHKLFRGMVYKLFSSCVTYDPKYQGMKEVLLNSEELEATALLDLYQGRDGGNFFCSPYWLDALIHLAGFVMNANDAVNTSKSVYISGGWSSMRFAEAIRSNIPYRIHVKMMPNGQNTVAGNVTVLQDNRIVALIGDLRFQQVAHKMLDAMIPPPSVKYPERTAILASKEDKEANSTDQALKSSEVVLGPRDPPKTHKAERSLSEKVSDIIAEEVGITVQEFSNIDSFEEMGIDSLLSLQIVARMSESLGIDFDGSVLQTHTTAQTLKDHIDSQSRSESGEGSDHTLSSTEMDSSMDLSSPSSIVDDKLSLLHSVVAEQLGVDTETLLGTRDLSDLGLDSLMELSIFNTIRERLGVDIKFGLRNEPVTLTSLEHMVGLVTSTPSISSTRPQRMTETQANDSLSVMLQNPGVPSAPTIFLFPDGSGSPAIYFHLRLAPTMRVISLQSPFTRKPQDYDCSFEALVELWIGTIRRHQPYGPYLLAGYSAGGYYAFEAAGQLQAAGDHVAHLVLIDSPCPAKYGPMPVALPRWLIKHNFVSSTADENIAKHFEATIRALKNYKPVPMSPSIVPPTTIVWASAGVGPKLHATPPLPSGVQMTETTEWLLQRGKVAGHDADGWEKLLPGATVAVKRMSGHHFNLLQRPNVDELGRLISDAVHQE